MKFWLMLLILGWRLRWLAWRNKEFQQAIVAKDMVMQWRTHAGHPSRWYHFNNGQMRVHGGIHGDPTVTLNFENAKYAADTLMEAGKNQMVFMQGMQEGKIKIEGNAGELMWFMSLMKYIVPKKKNKPQQP